MREAIKTMHPADIADEIEGLPADQAARILTALPPDRQGIVFGYFDAPFQIAMARALPRAELAQIVTYDVLVLPVVTEGRWLVGIVTVDDALDIARGERRRRLVQFGAAAHIGGGPDSTCASRPSGRYSGCVCSGWRC